MEELNRELTELKDMLADAMITQIDLDLKVKLICKLNKALSVISVAEQREQSIEFFKWLNEYEELQYTEKGIKFYVDEYLKSINCA